MAYLCLATNKHPKLRLSLFKFFLDFPDEFQANSLLDFVIDVFHLFSPRLLSAERKIGPSCIQRLPEAQYQDELYRCCHTLSKGSVVTFPEFGTAKGRVDFIFLPKAGG